MFFFLLNIYLGVSPWSQSRTSLDRYKTYTSQLDKPLELEPDAISEFWVPDSFFQHAKDAKAVRIMNPQASLQVTPEKMVIYVEMYVYYYSF